MTDLRLENSSCSNEKSLPEKSLPEKSLLEKSLPEKWFPKKRVPKKKIHRTKHIKEYRESKKYADRPKCVDCPKDIDCIDCRNPWKKNIFSIQDCFTEGSRSSGCLGCSRCSRCSKCLEGPSCGSRISRVGKSHPFIIQPVFRLFSFSNFQWPHKKPFCCSSIDLGCGSFCGYNNLGKIKWI